MLKGGLAIGVCACRANSIGVYDNCVAIGLVCFACLESFETELVPNGINRIEIGLSRDGSCLLLLLFFILSSLFVW